MSFKINIVNGANFIQSLPKKNIKQVGEWRVNKGSCSKESYTTSASICTIAHIGNPTIGYLSHSVPSLTANPIEIIKNTFERVADSLRRHFDEPLTGFLAGAEFGKELSMLKAEKYMEIFDSLGIDYSALLGIKNNGLTCLFASSPDQRYIVSPSNFLGNSFEALKKHYHIVKKADGHEFIF